MGSRSYRSEELLAYELGYRCEPHPRISFDIAAFYNIYQHLRTLTTGALVPPSASQPFANQPALTSNDMHAHAVGVELFADALGDEPLRGGPPGAAQRDDPGGRAVPGAGNIPGARCLPGQLESGDHGWCNRE